MTDDGAQESDSTTREAGRFRLVRPGLLSLLRHDEVLQPELLRFSGKVRALFCLAMMPFELVAFFLSPEGIRVDVVQRHQIFNTGLIVLDGLLGLWIWRGRHLVSTLWLLTCVCMVLEVASSVGLVWLTGSTSSYMVVFGLVLALVYRFFFGFRAGLAAFALMLLGMVGVVVAELWGWIPYAPMFVQPLPQIFELRIYSISAIVVVFALCFYVANVVMARLLHRERTIRVLRANLAAVAPGQLGQHTGRTLCGRYELDRLLGSGGMGEVYRGIHLGTRRRVAVKVLRARPEDDPTLLARFRREAHITAALGSPHIVEIVDIDQDDELPFIAFELLEGQSLEERLAQGPLALEEVASLVSQAARGLQVAHEAGVVHRDLKPANLFLARQGEQEVLKILDFGISKTLGQSTVVTADLSILGTPGFMAPEQAMGMTGELDHRADVFALGAIAYSAITGARPFEAPSIPALLRQICVEEPPPLPSLRPEAGEAVADVVAIAMAKRREERYGSVEELARDLVAAVRGELPDSVRQRARALHRGKPCSRTVKPGMTESPEQG